MEKHAMETRIHVRLTKLAVKDDSLKNLMMSWYYAGYYTGLHEGQQMAKQA